MESKEKRTEETLYWVLSKKTFYWFLGRKRRKGEKRREGRKRDEKGESSDLFFLDLRKGIVS